MEAWSGMHRNGHCSSRWLPVQGEMMNIKQMTLVEYVILVAILVILAAIAIPWINKFRTPSISVPEKQVPAVTSPSVQTHR